MKIIAHIKTDFPTKFGVPRQSGVIPENMGKIVFEKEYSDPMAVRGLDEFSHIWVIWEFSKAKTDHWSPTVRPPRLGGNKRVGVFATRSSFRPNPIGLSSVRLISVEKTKENGTVLIISGADLMDGTPIYDIKPYLAYTDSHPDAESSFAGEKFSYSLTVDIPDDEKGKIPVDKLSGLIKILENDPRPSYIEDEDRVYAFEYASMHIEFKVAENVLTVVSVEKINNFKEE